MEIIWIASYNYWPNIIFVLPTPVIKKSNQLKNGFKYKFMHIQFKKNAKNSLNFLIYIWYEGCALGR